MYSGTFGHEACIVLWVVIEILPRNDNILQRPEAGPEVEVEVEVEVEPCFHNDF